MFQLITMFIAIVLAIVIKKGLDEDASALKKHLIAFLLPIGVSIFSSLLLAHDAIGSRVGFGYVFGWYLGAHFPAILTFIIVFYLVKTKSGEDDNTSSHQAADIAATTETDRLAKPSLVVTDLTDADKNIAIMSYIIFALLLVVLVASIWVPLSTRV